jgi:hypothetical protein
MANNNINSHLIQLDLSSRHQELFDLHCLHDYFKDAVFSSAEIIPDSDTIYEMRKLHLLHRIDKKGMMIGYRMGEGSSNLQRLTKPMRLTFWLRVNDPYFLNYSELPFEFSNTIYYFSNRNEGKVDTGKKNLSTQGFVTGEDRIPIGGTAMRYEYASPLTAANVFVKDDFGDIAFDITQEGENNFVNLNLSGEPAGRYHVYVNNELMLTFYLVPTSVGKVLGVIDIIIDKEDKSIYSFFDSMGDIIRQNYTLRFKNRAIKWRYLLIENTPTPVHTDPQVIDARRGRNTEAIEFDLPREVMLENNIKAIEIATKYPIALKEVQEEKFKIRTKKGKAKVDSVLDLPCATARSNFKTNFENKLEVFSELLVYL